MSQTTTEVQLDTKVQVKDILSTIEREREQEIIGRRFGLFDRKETLEQIGEMLGITREESKTTRKICAYKT
jgi:DNA-directed RNA polymerase sigma subunit (sigma70/sigma32)